MGTFKTRRKHIAQGGTQIGASGDAISRFNFGVVSACVPAVAASAVTNGSAAVSGLAVGSKVWMWPLEQHSTCGHVIVSETHIRATGEITACFVNIGTSMALWTGSFGYIAFA